MPSTSNQQIIMNHHESSWIIMNHHDPMIRDQQLGICFHFLLNQVAAEARRLEAVPASMVSQIIQVIGPWLSTETHGVGDPPWLKPPFKRGPPVE